MNTAIPLPQSPSFAQASGKSFGIRAGAYILDFIVYYVVYMAVYFVVGFLIGIIFAIITGRPSVPFEEGNECLTSFFSFALFALYFTCFEGLYGATPGKLVLQMRVVRDNGVPCDLGSAFHRAILRLIDGILFGLVAYLNMKEPLYQRIGDKHAKTIVVGSRDPFIKQPREWWWFLIVAVLYLALNTITSIILVISMFR